MRFVVESKHQKALSKVNVKIPRSGDRSLERLAGWPLRCGASRERSVGGSGGPVRHCDEAAHESGSASKPPTLESCPLLMWERSPDREGFGWRGASRRGRRSHVIGQLSGSSEPEALLGLQSPSDGAPLGRGVTAFERKPTNPSHGQSRQSARAPRDQPGCRQARSPKGPAPTACWPTHRTERWTLTLKSAFW